MSVMTPEEEAEIERLRPIYAVLDVGYNPQPKEKPRMVKVDIPDVPLDVRERPVWFPGANTIGKVQACAPHLTYVIRSSPFVKIGPASSMWCLARRAR